MDRARGSEHVETVIIGGGQAGLSTAYHLARRGLPFVILDANERVGDSWRKRWDSLRLFTPARFSGLGGMPLPAAAHAFPSKDEVADYLEAYAARFELPVRSCSVSPVGCRTGADQQLTSPPRSQRALRRRADRLLTTASRVTASVRATAALTLAKDEERASRSCVDPRPLGATSRRLPPPSLPLFVQGAVTRRRSATTATSRSVARGSTGGRPGEFDRSRRSLGRLRSDGPRR